MMLFFNDPVEVPDPAVKACRMTMEMQSRFEALQEVWEARSYSLSLGVGIAQGVAIIGAIGFEGRRDYAAIGNVTNLAARLCAQAQGGQTIVCSVVAKNVSTILPVKPIDSLILKGFDEPVECFEMVNSAKEQRLEAAISYQVQQKNASGQVSTLLT
jgi:class 3 adenylate cyclase